MSGPAARVPALDSLRGLAALIVVVTHYVAAFYPYAVFGDAARFTRHAAWEAWLAVPPFGLLVAGHFAVCLFFVLSGYVLSVGLIGRRGSTARLVGAVVKRPVRLGGVLLFSLALAAGLISGDLLRHGEAAALAGSGEWFGRFWNTPFVWSTFLRDVVSGRAGSEYNPPLWTLRIELVGSFLVFALMLATARLGRAARTAVLLLALGLTYGRFYDGFVVGMLLAEARRDTRLADVVVPRAAALALLVPSLALAAFPWYAAAPLWTALRRSHRADWLPWSPWPPWADVAGIFAHVPMLAAELLFLLVLLSPTLRRPLERRPLRWLGEISYALYALHFLVLGSLSAGLYATLAPPLGHAIAVLATALVSLPVLLVGAQLVTVAVDRPTIRLSERVGRGTSTLARTWLERRRRVPA